MRPPGYAALIALTLTAQEARGQVSPRIEDIPPGADRIVAIKEGEPAPFSGALFDTPTAQRWGNWLRQYKLRLVLDVEYQKKQDEISYRALDRGWQLRMDAVQLALLQQQHRTAELEKRLQQPTPWYRTVWFGLTLGVVGTLAAGATAAYLLK